MDLFSKEAEEDISCTYMILFLDEHETATRKEIVKIKREKLNLIFFLK